MDSATAKLISELLRLINLGNYDHLDSEEWESLKGVIYNAHNWLSVYNQEQFKKINS